MTDEPLVTVVVPARNEAGTIGDCLDAILSQDVESLQVVVVDNGSTDGTPEELRRISEADPRVEVLSHPRPSIPGALNAALGAARGRFLVRVDAHSTIPPGYLRRTVDRLREGRWVGVGGRKNAVATTPTGHAIAAVLGSRLGVGGSVYHHGSDEQVVDHIPFGAYPTALVRALGGWDESIANNEDFEFDQRLRRHGELLFDPQLEIAWRCRETIGDLFRQYRRYGTGKPAVAVRHPGSVRLRHLLPPGLVAWLAAGGFVALRRPGWAVAAVAPYVVAVAAASGLLARHLDSPVARRAVPPALVAMQVGWGIGFWEGAARLPRSRARSRRTG